MAPVALPEGIILADTATKLPPAARDGVIVTGSHGGRYAAYLTLNAQPRAVIHNDAGIGRGAAGIAVIGMAPAPRGAAATPPPATRPVGGAARLDAPATGS